MDDNSLGQDHPAMPLSATATADAWGEFPWGRPQEPMTPSERKETDQ